MQGENFNVLCTLEIILKIIKCKSDSKCGLIKEIDFKIQIRD